MREELRRWTIMGYNMKPMSALARDLKAMPGQKIPQDQITIRLTADNEEAAMNKAKELVKRDEYSCSGLDLIPGEFKDAK